MHQRVVRNRVSEHLLDVLDKPALVADAVLSATRASRTSTHVDAMGYLPISEIESMSLASLRVLPQRSCSCLC